LPADDDELIAVVSAIQAVFMHDGAGMSCRAFSVESSGGETTVKSLSRMLTRLIRWQNDWLALIYYLAPHYFASKLYLCF
tara:strand:- start:326 stop:565 length:240 start_codon:yes stop_codon:yes gene_type:complete